LDIAVGQAEHCVFLSRREIARHLVADDSCQQWHSMPAWNVFAKRNQVNFSINLHSFPGVGNQQRSIVNITVLFVDCSQ
jgi:hypothetical protein